jgi:predicted Rossmann-fold nucleotide-binding protein/FMN phosphatase YigB (HAD superfamily)
MRLNKRIVIFGSFLTNSRSSEHRIAEKLGFACAQSGFTVICGGHGGIADSTATGAIKGGGEVLAITLIESKARKRNAAISPLITGVVRVDSLSERLEYFAKSDGYVFLTGGIGSLAEFAYIWHSLQIDGNFDKPIIFISSAWKHILAGMKRELMIKYKYYQCIYFCENVEDAVAVLTGDYAIKYRDNRKTLQKSCVLFDFDGTIVESPAEKFIKICENLGYFFQLPDVLQAYENERRLGKTPRTMNILDQLGVNKNSADDIVAAMHAECEDNQLPDLYPDVVDILSCLKRRGITTGALSSRHPVQLKGIIESHKLSGVLDHVLGVEDRFWERPKLMQRALDLSGFQNEDIVYVGAALQEKSLNPRVEQLDSILLDRHLTHILNDDAFKIRSLTELKYILCPKKGPDGDDHYM